MTKLFSALAVLLLSTVPAHAALDDLLDSAQTNRVGSLRVRTTGVLKEFATNDGKVFAATWSGRVSLRALLGVHYEAYVAAVHAHPGAHSFLSIDTPELRMRVSVHGEQILGRVCLPQSLPNGVSFDALR